MHAAVGGLTGNIEGALGAGLSAYAVPEIAKQINELDVPQGVKETLIAAAGTTIGAAVGGSAGATAAANQTINNYLTHSQIRQKNDELASCKSPAECDAIKEKWRARDQEQTKEAIECLTNGKCTSVMMTIDDIKKARDELRVVCASFCAILIS